MGAKSKDIPPELRKWNNIFEKLTRRYDVSQIFTDSLLWIMAGFSYSQKWDVMEYNKEERAVFTELFHEYVTIMNNQVSDTTWYDAWGNYYEAIASGGKRSIMGQFFTPWTVVDFMVQIIGTEKGETSKRINDPCSGSGRFIISHHVQYPGNFYYAEDLDLICCYMTCVNMLMHGAVGEVVWHNSLNPDDWRGGWHVNAALGYTGIPSIEVIQKEQSFTYRMWQDALKNRPEEAKAKQEMIAARQLSRETGSFTTEQMTLF